MKRSPQSAFINPFVVYALVALGSCGSLGVGVVWMRHQISNEAGLDKALESRLSALERRIEDNTAEIAAERDPTVLAAHNQEWKLGLESAREEQVVRVADSDVLRVESDRIPGLAKDQAMGIGFHVASQP